MTYIHGFTSPLYGVLQITEHPVSEEVWDSFVADSEWITDPEEWDEVCDTYHDILELEVFDSEEWDW